MAGETLHLSPHERLVVVSESPDALVVEATWTPGSSPPPAHLHPDQDERFEVRSGRLMAVVDGTERTLEAGDTLEIPRGTPHRMWNPGPQPAAASWTSRPALRTAEWFRTIDRLSEGGRRRPPLPAMSRAVSEYADVFRLAVGPKALRPVVGAALRIAGRATRD